VPREFNKCPRCGSAVSQFAAGCAVCGADLELLRRRRRSRLPDAMRISYDARELTEGAALTLLMVMVALFAPLYGMGLAAIVFFDRRRRGHRTMRNLAVVGFALALLVFFIPSLPYGQFGPHG
jgi:hypothetical protein